MAQAAHYPNRFDQPKPAAGAAFDWEERKDPRHIKLEDGEVFEGILTGIERIMINGKAATKYRAEDIETGEVVTFNGTYMIDSKLSPRDKGHAIRIRCEGTDKSVTRNGNAMKLFSVFVSKSPAPGWANDGTQITDEDIPFA